MTLSAGTRLGHYEILEPIGAGGMGEVFRARDTKLKRDVAIKVLPEAFARDEQRMKRFAREAELLASLNHPNIAAIYGLEESDGMTALVLELVEGPTLAERIAQGPIPLDEALPIARQMAEAMEAAHERGIIHRDLKPANAKVKHDGSVKVLDFGLAKSLDEDRDGEPSESPTGLRQGFGPASLSAAATGAGVIMGTAAYMSPEQARGKPVDRRADIWAFGVVLYEMLTGRRAFEAEDVSLTLAEVMKSEPNWDALPSDISPTLRTYLARCLKKDPKERVRDMGDIRLALDGAFEISGPASEPTASKPWTLLWVAAVVVTGLVAGLVVWGLTRPAAPGVVRFTVSTLPSSAPRVSGRSQNLAISPDGAWHVYEGVDRALHVRHFDRFETTRLDLVNAGGPFVSPYGTWIGFRAGGALQKVPFLGGPPTTICKIEGGLRGASWGADGTIVFADDRTGLLQVSAGGGDPRQLTKVDGINDVRHLWPEMLPGNGAVLFVIDRGSSFDIAVLSLETGEHRVLIRGGTSPRYIPTGHLVYIVRGALMVVPFDAEHLETTGDAVPVISGVFPNPSGAANFDVSNNGVMIYLPGDPRGGNRSLVWVDRLGREEPLRVESQPYANVALSPAGDRIVSSVIDATSSADVWIHNVMRGTFTRLTFDPGGDILPVWTPDGQRVLFQSNRDGVGLFWKAADGTGSADRLTDVAFFPFSVSPDGRRLVGTIQQAETTWDIAEVSLEGDPTLRPLVVGPQNQWHPQISPSGKWLAYMSRESGRAEIYVRPYPDVDAGRWQVSTTGGTSPMWSRSEEELFYRNEDQMVAVPVVTDAGFEFGTPSVLFEGSYLSFVGRDYDVDMDGQRFLMIKQDALGEESAPNEIHVVLNWFEELR